MNNMIGGGGTAYLFGYQYEFDYIGEVMYDWKLMFFPTAEGYVSAVYPDGITGGDPPKFGGGNQGSATTWGNLRMRHHPDNRRKGYSTGKRQIFYPLSAFLPPLALQRKGKKPRKLNGTSGEPKEERTKDFLPPGKGWSDRANLNKIFGYLNGAQRDNLAPGDREFQAGFGPIVPNLTGAPGQNSPHFPAV